jgi:hypothetical protein
MLNSLFKGNYKPLNGPLRDREGGDAEKEAVEAKETGYPVVDQVYDRITLDIQYCVHITY